MISLRYHVAHVCGLPYFYYTTLMIAGQQQTNRVPGVGAERLSE